MVLCSDSPMMAGRGLTLPRPLGIEIFRPVTCTDPPQDHSINSKLIYPESIDMLAVWITDKLQISQKTAWYLASPTLTSMFRTFLTLQSKITWPRKDFPSAVVMLLELNRVSPWTSILQVSNTKIQNHHSLVRGPKIRCRRTNRHFSLIGRLRLLDWIKRLVAWLLKTSIKENRWAWAEWQFKRVCQVYGRQRTLKALSRILRTAF